LAPPAAASPVVLPTAFAQLALARQKLGRVNEAAAALRQARSLLEERMPNVERGGLFGTDWQEWVICQIHLREAELVLSSRGGNSGK
jgi:hypothetical protein